MAEKTNNIASPGTPVIATKTITLKSPLPQPTVDHKRKCELSPLERSLTRDQPIDTSKLIESLESNFTTQMKTFQQSTQNCFKEHVNKLMNSFEAKLDAKAKEIQDSFTISLGVLTAQFEAEQAKRI